MRDDPRFLRRSWPDELADEPLSVLIGRDLMTVPVLAFVATALFLVWGALMAWLAVTVAYRTVRRRR